LTDIVREISKQGVRSQLSYKQTSLKQPTQKKGTIPADALFAVNDNQYRQIREWKEDVVRRLNKTTFSSAERFSDPKLNYTQECADRSLIDADRQMI
jgi:hypothetical protein